MDWRNFPSLNTLRAFGVVAETRSLTKAGEVLNVTHAAISQQIRTLETRLGVSLVIRDGRGVALTTEGETIARALGPAFETMFAALDAVTTAEDSRPINASMTAMFASGFLMPRLSDFVTAHPEVKLSFETTIEAVELSPGGVDLAIRYGTGNWAGLNSEMLLPGRLTVMASRKLIGDRTFAHPRELLDYPILQERDSFEFDDWLDKVGVPRDAPRNVVHMPGNLLLDGLKRGDGICATVPAFVEAEVRSGALITLFDDLVDDIGYYIVTRPGVQRPSLKLFLRWLRAQHPDARKSPGP
jgi:LysR family glycine cleavage system transcriptional activator